MFPESPASIKQSQCSLALNEVGGATKMSNATPHSKYLGCMKFELLSLRRNASQMNDNHYIMQ